MQLDHPTSPAPHPRRVRWLCLSALCSLSVGAWADSAQLTVAQLEERFWACDVMATRAALPAQDGARCAEWTDAFKQRRFGGDFDQLLAWWQARKVTEHGRRLATLATRGTADSAP